MLSDRGSWIVANGREGPRRCQTIRLMIEPMAMAAELREGAARLIDRGQSINQSIAGESCFCCFNAGVKRVEPDSFPEGIGIGR